MLDSGVVIAIATKRIWEQWGRLALRMTQMKLQLADGHIKRSLGLLEEIPILVCRVDIIHTLTVVDFHDKLTYNIILGRHFTR